MQPLYVKYCFFLIYLVSIFCIIYTYMPKRNEGVHNKQTLIL
jgi:hypothetical protein